AVQSKEAVEAAWGEAARFSDIAAQHYRCEFLVAFAARLCKDIEEGGEWSLNWHGGATKFNDFVAEWRVDIDVETATKFEKLVLLWAKEDSREQYALRMLDML